MIYIKTERGLSTPAIEHARCAIEILGLIGTLNSIERVDQKAFLKPPQETKPHIEQIRKNLLSELAVLAEKPS